MKIREIIAEESQLEAAGSVLQALKTLGKTAASKPAGSKGWVDTVNRYADAVQGAKAGVTGAATTTARAFFTLTSAGMSFLKTWQMLDPLYVYNKHMSKWEKDMKAGKITADQYELIREKELTQLIGQWTAILATNGMLRAGAMPLLAGFRLFGLNTIYSFVNTLTKGGQAALMYWWNTDEGRHWIASALALGVVDDTDYVSSIVGGNVAQLLDKLKGKVRKPPAGAAATGAASDSSSAGAASTNEPQSAEKPSQPPASNQKTNPQDYEYYSDTLVKNKKTGALELKDF